MATKLDINLEPVPVENLPDNVPPELVRNVDWALGRCPVNFDEPYRETERLLAPDVPPVMWAPDVVRTHPGTGSWIVSRYEDIAKVYQDAETFSTEGAAAYQRMVGETWPSLPLGVDPPEHMKYRMLLNPFFSPKAIDQLEPKIRERARDLLEKCTTGRNECDFSYDFARVFPVEVFLDLMGFPRDMLEQFLEWETVILHAPDVASKPPTLRALLSYLRQFIAEQRETPGTTLMAGILAGKIDGRPITEDEVLGTVFFLWLGGLDTVAATLAMMFRRLGIDQALQQSLREDPAKLPDAVEEFLRTQPLVMSQRVLKTDTVLHGVTMRRGDWITCLVSVGNFDPDEFSCPRHMQVERQPNRHFTFSGGPHRCLGSHLARRELRVALEEWLANVPPFSIAEDDDRMVYPALQSVRNLKLVW